jgi:serpin B
MRTPRSLTPHTLAALVGLAASGLPACGTPEPETTRSALARAPASSVSPALTAGATRDDRAFAGAVLGLVRGQHENLVFSPYSISAASSMLWAGARRASERDLAAALQLQQTQADRHAAMNGIAQGLDGRNLTLADSSRFELSVANDLWLQRGFDVEPAYLDVLATQYGAGVRRLDFDADPKTARRTINDWVASRTRDRIQDLFPEDAITSATVLALTNAVYFKADWAKAFSPASTMAGTFNLRAGGTAEVPFMRGNIPGRHVARPDLTAVELPYAGGELALWVMAPTDLDGFEAGLGPQTFSDLDAQLAPAGLDIALPKWKHELSLDLVPIFRALGAGSLFSREADLSGLSPRGGLFVQAMVHKAFIEVNEEGTEAAAATGISVGLTSALAPVAVTFDRPFVYAIVDKPLGTVLFLGRVGDPR